MDESEKQNPQKQTQRSFVISDYSKRDIPFALLAFTIISIASVVLGVFVESLSPFWRGYLWGMATTMIAIAILRQMLRTWPNEAK